MNFIDAINKAFCSNILLILLFGCHLAHGAHNIEITKDVMDLFEGNNFYGTFHQNLAKKAFKEINNEQLIQLSIKAAKTAFPDNSGYRAEFLSYFVNCSSQKLEEFILLLETNKIEYRELPILKRMDIFKNLLGATEKTDIINFNLPFEQISQNETHFIIQKEFSIAHFEDEKNVLATIGVGPCVAIGIYCPISKKVGLAHCDASTSVEEANFIWQVCKQTEKDKVKIYLLSECKKNISRFYTQFKKMGFPEEVFHLINSNESKDVAINSKNGRFFCFEYSQENRANDALTKRIHAVCLNYMRSTLDFIPVEKGESKKSSINFGINSQSGLNITAPANGSSFPTLTNTEVQNQANLPVGNIEIFSFAKILEALSLESNIDILSTLPFLLPSDDENYSDLNRFIRQELDVEELEPWDDVD
jgi:hypothetical protein